MKRLEVGKLYCVRETPLTVLNRPYSSFAELMSVVGYIDTSVPFLLLKVEGTNLQVLFEDKTGWIDIDSDNPVMEII